MILGIVAGAPGSSAPPIVTPAMLDPLHTGAGVALSNLNLTATKSTGGVGWRMSRSTYGPTSGKYYFESVLNEFSSSIVGVGLGDATASVSTFYGADQNGLIYINTGDVYRGGAAVASIQTTSEGQVIGVAFDVDAGLAWFRTAGGNWNNSGTANPATGVGGIAFGSLMSGATYPGAGVQTSPNDRVSVNFGPTFVGTPPAGFGIVGEAGPPSISGGAGITETT